MNFLNSHYATSYNSNSNSNSSSYLLLCNGNFSFAQYRSKVFQKILEFSDLIAVDGGANYCRKYDLIPQKIIGDLDSIFSETESFFREKKIKIEKISEQNSTDLEKALRNSKENSSENIDFFFCFGVTGDFFDHELSILHILQKNFYTNSNRKILCFSENQVFFVLPEKGKILLKNFSSDNKINNKISFYPLSSSFFKKSSGLKYPLKNLTLRQGKTIGTSNEAISDKISWEMGSSKNTKNIKNEKNCCLGFFPIEWTQYILENLYGIYFSSISALD